MLQTITTHINDTDTNQWNGLIHYAANGIPQAYKWYLKSISKEIELAYRDDYCVGQVIVPHEVPRSVANLIPVTEYFQMPNTYYDTQAFGSAKHVSTLTQEGDQEEVVWKSLDFSVSAQQLEKDHYSTEMVKYLDDLDPSGVDVTSGGSPDQMMAAYGVDNELERILVRLHYNAIQRSVAFASAVVDDQGNYLAASLFVYSHNALYEVMANPNSQPEYLAMLYHLICRNHAMKPMKLHFALQNPFVDDLFTGLGQKTVYRSNTLPDPKRVDDGYRPRNLSKVKQSWLSKLLKPR